MMYGFNIERLSFVRCTKIDVICHNTRLVWVIRHSLGLWRQAYPGYHLRLEKPGVFCLGCAGSISPTELGHSIQSIDSFNPRLQSCFIAGIDVSWSSFWLWFPSFSLVAFVSSHNASPSSHTMAEYICLGRYESAFLPSCLARFVTNGTLFWWSCLGSSAHHDDWMMWSEVWERVASLFARLTADELHFSTLNYQLFISRILWWNEWSLCLI